MELSKNEKQIIEILRELKPYEVIEIVKDQLGRSDYFLVKRTQKVVLKGDIVDKVVDK